MKIIDRLKEDKIHISFEVFPPKTDAGFEKVIAATDAMAKLNPAFISVTYGAGGGTSKNTAKIASHIKDDLGVVSLAHLTCASSTIEEVRDVIENLKENGIENILALRGDIPEGMPFPNGNRFRYAYELIEEIRKHGDFCIGAACYPEGHVENEHKAEDIRYLKQKVDSGVDFLTTQMFFDNDIHYNFLYRIREAGINVPVLPGIMPMTSEKQMKRSQELSGTVFPRRFLALLDRFGSSAAAMEQAGIAYATDQIIDLLSNGVNNIHIYTMNKQFVGDYKGVGDRMEKCFQEAVRYLGYGKNPVDEATSRLVEKGFLELEKVSALRSVFRIFEMNRIDEEKVAIGTLQISSKSLARNLNHCEKAVLFGATLGTGVDRLIARTSLTDMANAVVLQACAAAMLEEFCDEKQFEIGEELEKEGLYLRPRFSPGYGDFDIGFQKSFMQMLDCAKAIGLTMTESFMMTPTKSVTAVIGASRIKERCPIAGCEVCDKKECIYRR